MTSKRFTDSSLKRMKPTARMMKGAAEFNRIVLDSYFQSKPFPSETEIAHFVKCVKVPVEIVRAFLKARKGAEQNHLLKPYSYDPPMELPQKFSNIRTVAKNSRPSPSIRLSSPSLPHQPAPQYDVDFDQLFSEGHHKKHPAAHNKVRPTSTSTIDHQDLGNYQRPLPPRTRQDPVSLVNPSQQAPLLQSGLTMLYGHGDNMVLSPRQNVTSLASHKPQNIKISAEETEFFDNTEPTAQTSHPQMASTSFDSPQLSSSKDYNGWMTNDDIMFGDDDDDDDDEEEDGNKNSLEEENTADNRMDDSGYLTTNAEADSSLNHGDLGHQLKEAVLLHTSSDMMDNCDQNAMQTEFKEQPKEISEFKKERDFESLSKLRKLFLHRDEDGSSIPTLTVINVKQGFKKNVFEVELSDEVESSQNFFFKIAPGSEELRQGHIIKLTSLRRIGARICVDAFENVGKHETSSFDTAVPIEDSFFAELRRVRLDQKDIFELATPKSLNDFVELEEMVLHFIACQGGKANPLKVLFSVSRSQQALSPRLVKLLAKHLGMERLEVEAQINHRRSQPTLLNLLHDHYYCDLASVLS